MSDTGVVLKIVEIVISEEFLSKWYTFQQIAVSDNRKLNCDKQVNHCPYTFSSIRP